MATGEQNKLNAIKGIARLVSCSAEEKTNLANETIPKNVVVKVDDENDVYIGDGVSSLSILSPFKPSTAGNADSANEFTENQTIELRGDIAGTASSKAGWTIDAALNETGVTAGTYGLDKDTVGNNNTIINIPQITVNKKGLVTLITTHTLQTVNTTTDPYEVSADEAIEGVSVQAGVVSAATLENKINNSFAKYEASSDDINNLFIDNSDITSETDASNTSDTTETSDTTTDTTE